MHSLIIIKILGKIKISTNNIKWKINMFANSNGYDDEKFMYCYLSTPIQEPAVEETQSPTVNSPQNSKSEHKAQDDKPQTNP